MARQRENKVELYSGEVVKTVKVNRCLLFDPGAPGSALGRAAEEIGAGAQAVIVQDLVHQYIQFKDRDSTLRGVA